MGSDRLRRIEEIYHSALELDGSARAEFVARACAGDAELCKEVESLLSFDSRAASFIEAPAMEVAAKALAAEAAPVRPGQRLGRYEIVTLLGMGGAGHVYSARDVLLGRMVALKFLSETFTREPGRLRRFDHEARAASALNHPNILTVFESGQENGLHYIAAELVEGQTLRQRLTAGALPLAEALSVATQIAEALSAAHAAGIVHRDVKPENVMIRPDGYVKVLDFGLAKLTEAPREAANANPASASSVLTAPGSILGTARYMSPEQARGLRVDARTDLFSFGVVLYEMVSGKVPFDGSANSEVLAAILYREPPDLPPIRGIHPDVARIIGRALKKDLNERYATADDLRRDLEAASRRVETDGGSVARTSQRWRALRRVAVFAGVILVAVSALLASRRPVQSREVLRLCEQGHEAWQRRTGQGLRQAIEYYDQAVAMDSRYALAYVGLAESWALLPGFGGVSPADACGHAREAARHAMSLDDHLADVHSVMGLVLRDCDWDFNAAGRELSRAVALNPSDATARRRRAENLVALGRVDSALTEINQAQALDPDSALVAGQVGWVLLQARSPNEATDALLRAAQLDPAFGRTHYLLGRAYEQMRRYSEATASARKAVALSGDDPMFLGSLGHILGMAGDADAARGVVEELEQSAARAWIPPVAVALGYAGVGDRARAIDWLEKAFSEHDTLLGLTLRDPQFDPLKADPRFWELLRRFGAKTSSTPQS